MYHQLLCDASFWLFLFSVDQDLAKITREKACPCGGRLHRANYPRNPRGGPDDLAESYRYRLSFCCDRDGCRKRITPPSTAIASNLSLKKEFLQETGVPAGSFSLRLQTRFRSVLSKQCGDEAA